MIRPARTTLLLLALGLAGCGGGSGPTPSTAGAVTATASGSGQAATVVGNTQQQFVPQTVQAAPGRLALTLEIQGGTPHDLAFEDPAVGPALPVTTSGSATQTFTLDRPGTYRFRCTIHSRMVGQVVVR